MYNDSTVNIPSCRGVYIMSYLSEAIMVLESCSTLTLISILNVTLRL